MSLKNFTKNFRLITCSKDHTVSDVAALMKKESVGTILVNEKEKPVGIITDRDLVTRGLTRGKVGLELMASDVMSKPVLTVDEDASILDLIEKMGEGKVRRLCITDDKGRSVGLVSMADVFELLAHEISQLSKAMGQRHEKLFRRAKPRRGKAA